MPKILKTSVNQAILGVFSSFQSSIFFLFFPQFLIFFLFRKFFFVNFYSLTEKIIFFTFSGNSPPQAQNQDKAFTLILKTKVLRYFTKKSPKNVFSSVQLLLVLKRSER